MISKDGQASFTSHAKRAGLIAVLMSTAYWLLASSPASAGVFGDPTSYPVGKQPVSIAVGDLNGDHVLDIATANCDSDSVSVLQGQGVLSLFGGGSMKFGSLKSYAVGDCPNGVAIGDLNGDKRKDLVAANFAGSSISVRLGTAAGGLGALKNYEDAGGPGEVALGDFDRDGDLDVATSNFNAGFVAIKLNGGSGTFNELPNPVPTGAGADAKPTAVKVGDFNADSKADLVVPNSGADNVAVLLGNGAGGFSPAKTFPAGQGPYSVAIGDLDQDGRKDDVAVANELSSSVSVLRGSNGVLDKKVDLAVGSGPRAVAAYYPASGLVAQPGKVPIQNIVAGNTGTNTLSVLAGTGGVAYAAQQALPVGNGPRAIAVADFNGDLQPDLAVANKVANTVSVLEGLPAQS